MKKLGIFLLVAILALSVSLTACSGSDEKETNSPLFGNQEETAYRNETTGETFLYVTYTSDTVEIIGYKGSDALHAVTVPEKIGEKTVARIGNEAFKDNNAITEITLPDTVTEIGDFAFAGCDYLTAVHFSANLKTIGECAFYQSALTSVSLPASLETLGQRAFYQCAALEGLTIAGGALREIGSAAFYECDKLTSVIIPTGVETVGSYAFYNCTALANVTIPETVTEIGEHAFAHTAAEDNGTIVDPDVK